MGDGNCEKRGNEDKTERKKVERKETSVVEIFPKRAPKALKNEHPHLTPSLLCQILAYFV